LARWLTYKTDLIETPRCCALTQEGHHCRRQPKESEGWAGGLPPFLRLCNLHSNRYFQWRNEWESEQRQRLSQLATARRLKEEKVKARRATVYYVRRADGLIKIGYTGRDLRYRLSNLRQEHGPLEVLATHEGGYVAEQANHRCFAALRVTGEWFRPEPALLAHIDRINSRRASGAMPQGGT
jgi:hypothetical protein